MGRLTALLSPRCGIKDIAPRIAPTVFQALVHRLGVGNADLQVFLKARSERNLAEYEGRIDVNAQLLSDLIRCTKKLEAAVAKLSPTAVT
jgi:hypothetical protein